MLESEVGVPMPPSSHTLAGAREPLSAPQSRRNWVPTDQPWDLRQAVVRDPEGYLLRAVESRQGRRAVCVGCGLDAWSMS